LIRIHDREFKYWGSLSDIVKAKDYGSHIEYLYVNDVQEEQIVSDFILYSNQNDKDKPIKNVTKTPNLGYSFSYAKL
jgi:hypothetical protein